MLDQDVFEYDGSTFREVRDAAFEGEYDRLPTLPGLGLKTFIQFFNDSARNLFDRRDIRPPFRKLIHTNGICFTGLWRITSESSPYTGWFAPGREGLLLVRASVAGPRIKRGDRRAFGIAGKVWPTLDPDARCRPGNFVTVSGLSGTREPYITKIEMTNMPRVGPDPAANLINRVIFRLMDKRPGYRQLFPISTLGLRPGDRVVTPDLLRLKLRAGTPLAVAEDFRDELRLKNYPEGRLIYDIDVKAFEESSWTTIGEMVFTEDCASAGGDTRLHFWIPRDIPNPPHRFQPGSPAATPAG
jgi:hypothetical protein